ncbi:MAG TPA: T9SS type A sorting domain-containing protein [Chitinophagaceae bacterium]
MTKSILAKTLLRLVGVLLLMICFSQASHAQFTNISGIVNSYYQVIENVPSRNCVRVNTVAGLSTVDKVMIIQMKGASIKTANPTASDWGDTTALNNAGNYELAYICSIRGDSVFFVHHLLNNYTPVSGKVQLVTVVQYDDVRVTGTVNAKPWDETTGTGGVIAIEANNTLELQAPISADQSGYKGGIVFQHSGNCDFFSPAGTAYVYDADNFSSNLNGAHKGEGVADVTAATDGGKGAPANGGGGGNNHNNSGGGGSNLAAGGRGGGNSSNGPFGCNTANNQGQGGWPLGSWGGKKVFAGGGGGAGHNNNAIFMLGGGNGGGVVYIHATTLISNGHKITSNGGIGGNSQGDGAGGGGGGGTLIMDVDTYTDAVSIEAKGGNGGNSDDVTTPGRCFGGGGGGSGGVIYMKAASPAGAISIAGGTGGLEFNRSGTCGAAVPGLNGAAGSIVNNYAYRIGNIFGSVCGTLLPVSFGYFKAALQQSTVALAWKIYSPETVSHFVVERMTGNEAWREIQTVQAGDNQELYTAIDPHPYNGDNFYRIRIIKKNNAVSYSPTRFIFISSQNEFVLYPNPVTDKIFVRMHYNMPANLEMIDIKGRIVMRRKILSPLTEIQVSTLSKGIYAVRIGDVIKKLIVQ